MKKALHPEMQNFSKNNFIKINLREVLRESLQIDKSDKTNLGNQDSTFQPLNTVVANTNFESDDSNINHRRSSFLNNLQNTSGANPNSTRELLTCGLTEQPVKYVNLEPDDDIPSSSLKRNEPMDVSENIKSNAILAAVVLPPDQRITVHKVKDSNKHYLKEHFGRCCYDSTLKSKLRNSQKVGQRLLRKMERLKEENTELASSLRRANNLLRTYFIEKLQKGIKDDDFDALLLKNQLIAYSKKKRDW